MDLANYCEDERKVQTYEVYLKCCNCNCQMNFVKPLDNSNNNNNSNIPNNSNKKNNSNSSNNNKNTHHVYECPRCKIQTIKDIKYPFIKYVY